MLGNKKQFIKKIFITIWIFLFLIIIVISIQNRFLDEWNLWKENWSLIDKNWNNWNWEKNWNWEESWIWEKSWIITVSKQTWDKWQMILISDFSSEEFWLWIYWKYWSKTPIEVYIDWEYSTSFLTNEDWTFKFKSSYYWELELRDKDTWKVIFKKNWNSYQN